jgi:hypothetical protein
VSVLTVNIRLLTLHTHLTVCVIPVNDDGNLFPEVLILELPSQISQYLQVNLNRDHIRRFSLRDQVRRVRLIFIFGQKSLSPECCVRSPIVRIQNKLV